MVKKIIVLDAQPGPDGSTLLRAVFWFDVPAARRVPIPQTISSYRDATPSEVSALQDGSVLEKVASFYVPAGATGAQVKGNLEARYASALAKISGLPNPNKYYGASWDGTVWSS